MTSPGRYAAQDGSFARSAGGAAGRGVVLIVVAVVIGLVLLARGFDGSGPSVASDSSESSSAPDDTTADGSGDEVAPDEDGDGLPDEAAIGDGTAETPDEIGTTSDLPGTTNPPGEVRVAAINATGESGVAGRATALLDTQGYVTAAKNSVSPAEISIIYYRAGFSEDAKAVASHLSAPADIILPAPDDVVSLVANSDNVADFDVFVIQGTDGLAGQ